MRRPLPCVPAALLALSLAPAPVLAQEGAPQDSAAPDAARTLDAIEVVGVRTDARGLPGAVATLDADALRDGQRGVSLSESLQRVPGVTALDRQNFAQDLQVQSRGYGARSTFGIRGLRLVVDGLPASAADGQSQAAGFPLSMLDRVDVLRGPLALAYGNAAGGVIVGRSVLDAPPAVELGAWWGSDATGRAMLRVDAGEGDAPWRVRLAATAFTTDGARPQSAARRNQFNAIAEWRRAGGDRWRVVFNSVHQPFAQDPLGLTRAAFDADPRGTDPVALQFDTRKTTAEDQLGLRWESAPGAVEGWVGAWGGTREVEQFLAIPVLAQRPASSAGGVIDLRRDSLGADAGLRWRFARGTLVVGVESTRLREDRRGYENFIGSDPATARLGVRGQLRRDERNRVDAVEAYAALEWTLARDWRAMAGLRHARVRFASDDAYLANGDDSGGRRDARNAWSFGVTRSFAWGEAYASVGRGFETPTLTETSYRPDGGAGFNTALRPARTDAREVGLRARTDDGDWSTQLALYRIDGEDEIVPALSRGGRASFTNAGQTRREGVEWGVQGALGPQWRVQLAASWIRARFTAPFTVTTVQGTQVTVRTVAAGNRIPGIPRADAFAELEWRAVDGRWSSALEVRALGAIAVDDRNSDAAAGHARVAWRVRHDDPAGRWYAFLRVDNLLDRDAAGSVIVNEGNGRFFEPAAPRTLTVGGGWRF